MAYAIINLIIHESAGICMENLTEKQQAIYEFIKNYISDNSYPPTVREIGAAVSLKSTSTVHMHLKEIEKKGYISISPLKQRTISLTGNDSPAPYRTVATPLVGNVAAGKPILAEDNIQETYALPSTLLHGASNNEVMMLNVEGDSMIDAGILSGDMIIVHNAIAANNGDIVVARVEGDTATVKRLYKEKGVIRLQPENSNMKPIYASPKDVEIVGKVIGLIRKY